MKLADVPPVACSACNGQYPDRRHIDFQAAWDGPTFPQGVNLGDGNVRTNLTVAVDDLVLCENCLTQAGRLVGLQDTTALQGALDAAEETTRELRERLAGQADYIDRLEQAAESRGRLSAELTGKPRALSPQGPAPSGRRPRAKQAA